MPSTEWSSSKICARKNISGFSGPGSGNLFAASLPILSVSGDSVAILIEDGLRTIGSWWNGVPHEPQGTIEWFDKNGVLLDKGTGEFNKHGNDSWAYDQRGFDYVMSCLLYTSDAADDTPLCRSRWSPYH